MNILKDLVEKKNGKLSETRGISIKHDGRAGAILAKLLIAETDRGFSSTMTLIDPQMNKSSRLHGAGLRLGRIAGEELNQILVVRNTGDKLTKISGKVIYTNETEDNNEVVSIEISSRNIAANQTKTINLKRIIDSANIPSDVEIAGIEME
ncbi:MAG: hypothetical protein ACR2MD_07255 [Aridibacter sp.]